MEKLTLGLAICGSFCTHAVIKDVLPTLTARYRVIPIFSESVQNTDTRFGKANDFCREIEAICQNSAIRTVVFAETIGPKKLFDVLAIAPCTGNTLAKLAHGIIDATVPMAAKAHLRNERPLVIALASNDALAQGLSNLAALTVRKHCYFVPLGQDDPIRKPTSLVADFTLLPNTVEKALEEKQLQPMLIAHGR